MWLGAFVGFLITLALGWLFPGLGHLIGPQSDEYYTAVAKTTEEAKKLIEDGFGYVCTTPEGLMRFRKRE